MRRNLWLTGFVLSALLALWPIWPAWMQLEAGPATAITGISVLSLLLHLAAENPRRHQLVWGASLLGWVVAVNAAGEAPDLLDWASSFVLMFLAGYASRLCLATYSRRREGVVL